MGEAERGESAPRIQIAYFCANDHVVKLSFATTERDEIPLEWDCPQCGGPAGLDRLNPPKPTRSEPYKTHLAYVKERRTDAEGEALLTEALEALRARRGGA
jgi:hypothetical protein